MGLLDGFMPQQNPYGANDDQQKAALLTGLLSAGFGALTGRRGAPLNSIGRAGLLGLGGYSGALDSATNQNMRMAQLEEQKQTGLLNRENLQAQMAERAAKLARERGVQETIAGLQPPRTMLAGPMPDGMTMPPVQGQISPDMIAAALLQKGYGDEAGKYADIGNKLAPKTQVIGDKIYEIGPDGLKELGGPGKPIDYNKPFLPDGRPNTAYQQYALNNSRAGASKTDVTIKQDGEESKAVGKFFGEQFADVQKAGFNAQGKLNRLDRLDSLLKGVDTGKLTPVASDVAQTAQSLGFKVDPKWNNVQAAEALSNEMALELRNPSGGAGMPGAMSDADRMYLKSMVPGIEKTPEGRRMIIEANRAMAKRDQDVARLAREYRKKTGKIDEGFYEDLSAWSERNPLFKTSPAPAGAGASGGWSITPR